MAFPNRGYTSQLYYTISSEKMFVCDNKNVAIMRLVAFRKCLSILYKLEVNMDVRTVIWKRKSCRMFEKKEITLEYQKEILRAAQQAPSPKNEQPWRFIVVTDAETKEKLATILSDQVRKLKIDNEKKGINRVDLDFATESVKIIRQAPMLVFVYMNMEKIVYHEDGVRWKLCAKDVECTNIMAVGAAIENMLLRATDMGIDSLWMGDIFYAYNELVEFLKIDGEMMAAIALGYGKDTSKKRERKPLSSIIKMYGKNAED